MHVKLLFIQSSLFEAAFRIFTHAERATGITDRSLP